MSEPVVLRFDELMSALMRKGYDRKTSDEYAAIIMNYFGYSDTILDNNIDTEERDLFWKLEDDGILKGEWGWEETFPRRYEGLPLTPAGGQKIWRVYHWTLKISNIRKLNSAKKESKPVEEENVYSGLPHEVWERGEAGEKT
ncbi:MAG: hypothetical protein QXU82_01175 [Candidatus Aenigmatarchaeota archaeon]